MTIGISFQDTIFNMQPSIATSRHLGTLTRPWLKQGNLNPPWNIKKF